MSSIPLVKKEYFEDFQEQFHNEQIQLFTHPIIKKFTKQLKNQSLFNLFFFIFIVFEIIYVAANIAFLVQSYSLAIHLALIFASIFSFFAARIYLKTKQLENIIHLKDEFLDSCRRKFNNLESPEQIHFTTQACCKLAADLHGVEHHLFQCPNALRFLNSFIEKINCFNHWEDVHYMKELLLHSCVEEQTKLVKIEPTQLESHAGLANAYVMLSGLYIDPRSIEELMESRWIPPNKYNESFQKRFRAYAERAIEEFKILSDFAPNDPWVHSQLAYSYRDLQMPIEEIKEVETLLKLCPDDQEILFRLGKLYFSQGMNAKGLQIFETLKKANYKKAELLMNTYGDYKPI